MTELKYILWEMANILEAKKEYYKYDEIRKRMVCMQSTWAEEHEYLYTAFENMLEEAYHREQITAKEHDRLAYKAFFDYDKFYHEDVDTLWDD